MRAQEIADYLDVVADEDLIAAVDALLMRKKAAFDRDSDSFTYCLRKPLILQDGSTIDTLKVRELTGEEFTIIKDPQQTQQYAVDLIARQNSLPTAIAGRILLRDIQGIGQLLGFFFAAR